MLIPLPIFPIFPLPFNPFVPNVSILGDNISFALTYHPVVIADQLGQQRKYIPKHPVPPVQPPHVGARHLTTYDAKKIPQDPAAKPQTKKQPPTSPVSLDRFIANIDQAGGFARLNKYSIAIPINALMAKCAKIFSLTGTENWMKQHFTGSAQEGELLTAFCLAAQIPGYQFQLESNRHYGPAFKIPHLPEYQDITFTFLCGGGMLERYFFDAWMYMVMDRKSNNFNYMDEYSADIEIYQYRDASSSYVVKKLSDSGEAGWSSGPGSSTVTTTSTTHYTVSSNYHTTLKFAYPIAITAQPLGYELNNDIQKVEVTFAYKYAVPDPRAVKLS